MTDIAILNCWLFTSSMAILIAIALLAYCVWDGWGRYKKMYWDLEKWRRKQ